MPEFLMPRLGADMTAGKVVAWLKQPGERVERGDIIAVVETDKTNVDVESFIAGVLEKILVQPGDDPLAFRRGDHADLRQHAGMGYRPHDVVVVEAAIERH